MIIEYKCRLNCLVFLLFISHSFICSAEDRLRSLKPSAVKSSPSEDPVIDFGLILDETVSKPGSDFYEIFYLNWQQRTKETITIRIQEQLGFFRASFILLWLDDDLVFKQRLPLRNDEIEQAAIVASKVLNRRLLERFFVQKQLKLQ